MPLFLMILLFILNTTAEASERDYQLLFCKELGGHVEFKINHVRIDCLTDRYAIEVDFAKKWYEAIGQALYYSILTGKRPAIAIIADRVRDKNHLKKINYFIENAPVQIKYFEIRK